MSQSAVNIVYPIDGGTYPITAPECRVEAACVTASFSVTCPEGSHGVAWGFDGSTIGEAQFYDQFTAQFTWNLRAGPHSFFVGSDCGKAQVTFEVV